MVDQGSKKGKEDSNEEEWDFTNVKPTIKYEEPEERKESQVKDTKVVARRKPKLTLDETNVPQSKTRSQMAAELMGGDEEKEEDSFVLASYPKRAVAFIIDVVFLAILGAVVFYSAPLCRKLLQLFLDRYKLQFIFPEPVVMNAILVINAVIAVFLFVVIPVAFYNHSFGKKFLGLKVRSVERFRISIDQAFQREVVYKPLGILIIAGFFIPFFNKRKQALHDLLAETLVIEE